MFTVSYPLVSESIRYPHPFQNPTMVVEKYIHKGFEVPTSESPTKTQSDQSSFPPLSTEYLVRFSLPYFNCWTENTAGNKCLQIWLDYLILYICIDLVVDVLAILAICFYQKLKLKEAYNAFRKDFHSDIVQLIQKNSCSSEIEKKTWHQASFLKALSCKA